MCFILYFFVLLWSNTSMLQSMKRHTYFYYYILCGVMLAFFASACEDEYRDIVFFAGAEPVYQLGICDNVVTSSTLYMTDTEPTRLGLDGGDGEYVLSCSNPTVVSATLAEDSSGHKRVSLLPKAEGIANVVITDGNGGSAMLSVHVLECYKLTYKVLSIGFGLKGGNIDDAGWQSLCDTLKRMQPVQINGCYELVPDDRDDSMRGGKLKVYAGAGNAEPVGGTYRQVEAEDGDMLLQFCLDNGNMHVFSMRNPLDWPATKDFPIAPLLMWEEVTSAVSSGLPDGCSVYRAEEWLLLSE